MGRRKRYSAEFKRQALRRANEPGVTDALVAEELGVSTHQLRRWRDAVTEHGEALPGPTEPGIALPAARLGQRLTERWVSRLSCCVLATTDKAPTASHAPTIGLTPKPTSGTG